MNISPDKLHWVQQWIDKAEHDRKAARHLLALENDCPTDTVCFHAQQCAEKYIKAFLSWLDIDFPKSHDLQELLLLLPENQHIPLTTGETERLTDYAVSVRYPDDTEYIPVSDAAEAVEIAEKVRLVVRANLPQEIFGA